MKPASDLLTRQAGTGQQLPPRLTRSGAGNLWAICLLGLAGALHCSEFRGLRVGPSAAADSGSSDAGAGDGATHCATCIENPRGIAELALGDGFACALFNVGAVKCWGSNRFGVLGQALTSPSIADPLEIGVIDFGTSRRVKEVAAGAEHVCVRFEDGKARCWGNNEAGQLGLGSTEAYGDQPGELPAALADLELEGITGLSAGVANTCALLTGSDEGATVHCWGSDIGGALGDERSGAFGDDEAVDPSRPVALPEPARRVAAGHNLACAELVTDSVHCWGDNWARTLGTGDTCDIGDEQPCASGLGRVPDIPVTSIDDLPLLALAVEQTRVCVIDRSRRLRCWGRNSQSRSGYPQALEGEFLGTSPGPVLLGRGVQVSQVGLGVRHTCTLDGEGDIRCFGEAGPALGYGFATELGTSAFGDERTPEQAYEALPRGGAVDLGVPSATVRALYSGGDFNCVVLEDDSVRCWGGNDHGQLGYGHREAIGDDGSPAEEYEVFGRSAVELFDE